MTALQFDMQQAANATLNMTDQVQGLTNAFNVLLGPFATALQDTVTWKQGNEALKIALEKTHGAINLNTKAGQAAASMLATAIQNTIALSEAQANMPGHMSQAIGTIQKEIAYLRSLHSNSKIVQQALHDLQAQLDALHSKSITLTVNTVSTGGGIGHITIPGSGPGGGNRINAITGPSPGVAIGPSSVSVNASQPVIHNHVFIDSREVFGATQKRAVRRQKRNGFNGLTRVIR
jgi:hypothetical protein